MDKFSTPTNAMWWEGSADHKAEPRGETPRKKGACDGAKHQVP